MLFRSAVLPGLRQAGGYADLRGDRGHDRGQLRGGDAGGDHWKLHIGAAAIKVRQTGQKHGQKHGKRNPEIGYGEQGLAGFLYDGASGRKKRCGRETLTALYVQSVGNLNCSTSCFSPAASVESCSLAEAPS